MFQRIEYHALKTYAATFHAHQTGKDIWVLSFDHLQIRINTVFRYSYVIFMIQDFLNKICNQCVTEISIDLLSELIVPVLKTDTCRSGKSNDVHN